MNVWKFTMRLFATVTGIDSGGLILKVSKEPGREQLVFSGAECLEERLQQVFHSDFEGMMVHIGPTEYRGILIYRESGQLYLSWIYDPQQYPEIGDRLVSVLMRYKLVASPARVEKDSLGNATVEIDVPYHGDSKELSCVVSDILVEGWEVNPGDCIDLTVMSLTM